MRLRLMTGMRVLVAAVLVGIIVRVLRSAVAVRMLVAVSVAVLMCVRVGVDQIAVAMFMTVTVRMHVFVVMFMAVGLLVFHSDDSRPDETRTLLTGCRDRQRLRNRSASPFSGTAALAWSTLRESMQMLVSVLQAPAVSVRVAMLRMCVAVALLDSAQLP